ncbi:spermidine/putrescine ABC transporter substrate-binding protein [Nocardioides sp. W7]|uniref:polyamine ABC transporter substrate-binding protein n=1 Tax=Nocardioides sp. W7 TaxID=2931390 RepID=UPI001FD5E42D|nr:spermidine/putrescine ABC transporter substrate-binding protein [Nocardioides sp. W7]
MTSGMPGPGRGPGFASRRTVLRGVGTVAFLGASAAALKLPIFGTDGFEQDPATCRATDLSSSQKRLVISNWPGYIDSDEDPSTLSIFQDRTGITVDYSDDVNDNAEFYAKVRNQLGTCTPIDRDMVMLTDWMAARFISLGWTQPYDKANVPNLHANLLDALRDRQWDPDLEFHAPWQTGLTGIAYNAAKTGEVRSFEELLTRADLRGRVTLLSEMRDTMAFMLKVTGADPRDFDDDQWGTAIERLRKVVASDQIRAFTGNEYTQDLAAGNILACEAWSGDVIQLQADNPDIKFVTPEEGLALWSDNMIIPNHAIHQANAEKWIDYYYEPAVAAQLAAYVNYICPVKGAQEEMEKLDPDLAANPLIFPDDDMLANTFDFMPLDARQSNEYEGDWANVTGG